MTMIEKMRLILTEAFSEGRVDALDELLAPDFVNHNAPPGVNSGVEGVKQIVRDERRGIPDMKYTVLHEAEDGDLVFQHAVVSGTHLGMLFGVPGTGRHVEWKEMHVARVRDGRCVEHWGVTDMASLWVQIGRATPPPSPAAVAS
jgi:predicted ester cyclase